MSQKKQLATDEGTTSEDKSIATAVISPNNLNLSPIMKEMVYVPSQGAAGDIHPLPTYEAQRLQMFTDMKEEIAKQQTLLDRKRERLD